ncbi:MAG: SRPBCC family protein [Acidimicrobiia bacterium]|nr:SRPBCC family protein [Acidimicrobiia bacterium]
MKVSMSVDIDPPPERVWPYLVEPEKTMSWYTSLQKFEYTSDGAGPDSTFYWEEDVRGKIYWNHFRTTEWVANRVFAYVMTSSSFFKAYTERWEIEPTASGCRFSFNDTLVFPYGPWGKVMGFFGERMAKKSSQQILQNLKRLAEADTRP